MRRRIFTIDAGAAQLLERLNTRGQRELGQGIQEFERCLSGRIGQASFVIGGDRLPTSLSVRNIRLELHPQAISNNKIVVTVNFISGIVWRRGSLRIPNVTLPQATKAAVKGKTVGEIVSGAPFPEYVIRNVIEDKSVNGNKLRIRCTGDEQVGVPGL